MKPRTAFLSLAVAYLTLMAAGLSSPTLNGESGTPEYRILNQDRMTLGDSWNINYWVRVDQYLTETEMKMVVCAVLAQEKPDDYSRLAIFFSYRLDSFNFVYTDEYSQSWIGRYAWNKKLRGSPYSLFRPVDENGRRLPRSSQFSRFDHTRECSPTQREGSTDGEGPGPAKDHPGSMTEDTGSSVPLR